jgi:hypothetical protein
VMVAPGDVLRDARGSDSSGRTVERGAPVPKDVATGAWWWDAAK